MKRQSSAMKLIRHVWDHNREATGFSWERLNQSMFQAVKLAIEAGLHFAKDDFKTIWHSMNGHKWFYNDGADMMGEGFYQIAVKMNNLSACQSFEAWKERPPFIHEGKRLDLRERFYWQAGGRRYYVTLTSFAQDGQSITAVTYKPEPKAKACPKCKHTKYSYSRAKIDKRFKITIEELRAKERQREKEIKDAKKLQKGIEKVKREGIAALL